MNWNNDPIERREREIDAMTFGRALALAIAVAAGSAVTAGAQTLPWPANAPQPQPQQAPWPGNAPAAAPMSAPAGPMMGGPPAAPTATQQACLQEFTGYRSEVEKRALAAKAGSEKKVAREEMCKLVSAYSSAEATWIKFSIDNMAKCGIPKQAVDQIKSVHVHTADIRKKICEAGPGGGGPPAAPSLSDALGTTRLPTQEAEKTKPGGSLDTLTGNALTR
jgi:hypothetical protein